METSKEPTTEAIEPVPIKQAPQPITYYAALQGCRSVDEFECLNKIEEGAYGVVFRAKDKKSSKLLQVSNQTSKKMIEY